MQSNNQVDNSVHQYSTGSPSIGRAPTTACGPAAGDTEDYPEISDDHSSTVASAPQPPASTPEPPPDGNETEHALWEGRTSPGVFLVRFLLGAAITIAWVGLAIATWGFGYGSLVIPAYILGVALLLFWVFTGIRFFRATYSHYYQLTDKRLLITTGYLRRRIDQVELLRVKDVFVQQNILGSWLGLGHVVVISSEQTLPRATLFGIAGPREVMDLIWRQGRAELDRKTSRIETV
jgi:hypothetical protein